MPIQIDPSASPRAHQQQENVSRPAKYSTLYIYAGILQVSGWIVVGSSFVVTVIGSGFTGLITGFGTAIAGLVLIATGQLICVWRDTEENTRRIADLLENKK